MADLGFHEGGFAQGRARLRARENFCKPRPLPAIEALRFILAACSLEVVSLYTDKIAITVDRKKK